MTKIKLKRSGYGKRWHIESFFSGLKRTTGSALNARTDLTLHHEARAFHVLAYTLNRRCDILPSQCFQQSNPELRLSAKPA